MNPAFAYLGTVTVSPEYFDCGEPELNRFLQSSAYSFSKQGLSAVKLLIDRDSHCVIGFYAISPTCIDSTRLSKQQKEQYHVTFPIPAWLIGRLAVDKKYQKLHLGEILLQDALCNIRERARQGAGALIIVDAKNKKIKGFYKKYGFATLPSSGLKMAYPIATLE